MSNSNNDFAASSEAKKGGAMSPYRQQAKAFLNYLDPDADFFTFQSFDDDADRKDPSLAKVLHGTLDEHFAELVRLQKSGAGIFVTINETDRNGRKTENIKRVRALFVDLDGSDLKPVKEWNAPDIVCETSPGRWHAYWLVRDAPIEKFRAAQNYLATIFDADKNVKDLPRVMRLPGFYHQKKDSQKGLDGRRHMVTFTPSSIEIRDRKYAEFRDKLKQDFPQESNQKSVRPKTRRADRQASASVEEVNEALTYIDPDALSYQEWVQVLFAIQHHFGEKGAELAEKWSARGEKHKKDDIKRRWGKFNSNGGVTIKTVFNLAKQNGCDLAALAKKHRRSGASRRRSFEDILSSARSTRGKDIEELEDLLREVSSLQPLQQDTVLKEIKTNTGINLGALRTQLKFQNKVDELNHLTIARAVIDHLGRDNMLCTGDDFWIWRETGVWVAADQRLIRQSVQKVLEDENIEVTAGIVGSVTEVLKNELYIDDHEFNLGSPETVNCLNGEIHLENNCWVDRGQWLCAPHQKESYRTTQIPTVFDDSAQAPRFEAFLEEVFEPDADKEDKIEALLSLMGYTLMSHSRHEKFVMLIGAGANGKSVLLSVLEGLCGRKNTAGVQPSSFDRTFQRAHLHMKLANIVSELKQGEVIADAELKAITSGEPCTVEQKFKNPFEMRPFATCWFGTNHMPHTRDFSEALFRRAVIITFNRVFPPEKQNRHLKEELRQELPGILNLALKSYSTALSVGFTEPESSKRVKGEWKLEADQVALFVDDCCKIEPQEEVKISKLYGRYKLWADGQSIKKIVALKGFRDRLTRLGYGHTRKSDGKYVTGLKIIEENIGPHEC